MNVKTSSREGFKHTLAAFFPKSIIDHYHAYRKIDVESLKQHIAHRFSSGTFSPVPGPVRMVAVAGTADVGWFLKSGKAAFDGIAARVEGYEGSLAAVGPVLDFGCGCGRVIRHWRGIAGVELVGCDYDPRSIRWCDRHLDFATFVPTRARPPTPFPDGRFGLVYALSVFTHIAEELQQSWIDELGRILRPGGLLYFTTHGKSYDGELSRAEREAFERDELVVRNRTVAGTNLCGVYHPQTYVETMLRPRFELLEHLPEGAPGNPHQDVWLARRPGAADD